MAILDSNGTEVVQYNYNAWGQHIVFGSNVTLGNLNPFRYRGYFYDTETQLYFLKTRYYDPQIGRFINMDSIKYAAPETINGLNLYSYCGNNPVMNVDPTGHFFIGIFIAVVLAAAAIGGTINDIVQICEIQNNYGNRIDYEGNEVKIVDSYKVETPWMQLGYSIYLNHFNPDTKNKIKGSSVGVMYEWGAHNLAYAFGKVFKIESIIKKSQSVDIGATILSDNHNKGFAGFASKIMKASYAAIFSPILPLLDLIVYRGL